MACLLAKFDFYFKRNTQQFMHTTTCLHCCLTRCRICPILPSIQMVITIPQNGLNEYSMSTVTPIRPKGGESEKITINLGYVDLGQIDLLVQEGFYSNRTDFIRTAIRNQLNTHAEVVKQTVTRKTLELGLRQYSKQDLEAVQQAGEKLHIQVVGLVIIAADVTPELALATIEAIHVLGALQASTAIKTALAARIF